REIAEGGPSLRGGSTRVEPPSIIGGSRFGTRQAADEREPEQRALSDRGECLGDEEIPPALCVHVEELREYEPHDGVGAGGEPPPCEEPHAHRVPPRQECHQHRRLDGDRQQVADEHQQEVSWVHHTILNRNGTSARTWSMATVK